MKRVARVIVCALLSCAVAVPSADAGMLRGVSKDEYLDLVEAAVAAYSDEHIGDYAATRGNDGVLRLYQGTSDGRLYCIADDMSDIVLDSGLPFYLGQDGTGRYGCTYNGFIDDFALWTRTLSHDDVKRIYEAGRQGLAQRHLGMSPPHGLTAARNVANVPAWATTK